VPRAPFTHTHLHVDESDCVVVSVFVMVDVQQKLPHYAGVALVPVIVNCGCG
jgi:hypothetical protein